MIAVGLYIEVDNEFKRIELFDDEKISVTSSIQNVNDISKTFTDYSQSFTIPATTTNNRIFKHWYENSIDNGFDQRQRQNAYIELDTIPFRKGKIQLEKASIKNNFIENYTITFFGALVSLKDTFAGKKLKDLDFSDYNITYNSSTVVNSVQGQIANDVKFPLISSKRIWDDITSSGTPMLTTELFPALRLNKVLEAIENYYNINFSGSFLTNKKFTNAFLWLKNAELFEINNVPELITYQTSTILNSPPNGNGIDCYEVNLTNSTFRNKETNTANIAWQYVQFTLEATVSGINFKIHVFKNGAEISTQTATTNGAVQYFDLFGFVTGGFNTADVYSVKISSTVSINFDSTLGLWTSLYSELPNISITQLTKTSNQITATSTLNLATYMPDITVEEFFSGILKMFNLTCYSFGDGIYNVQQLEDWYTQGKITDITPHVITDSIEIERLKTYKKINFKYQKSENLLSRAYFGNNGIEYGDLIYETESDGPEYTIQLPFENLMFEKLTGQNLQLGFSLNSNVQQYIPKPIILYDYNTLQSCNFYLSNGATTTNVTTYNAFGQDTLIDSVNHSLNFGLDVSTLLLVPINNSLFIYYYYNYLNNIFTKKARTVKVKCILPISLLSSIQLNDRLIIRDKRYIINSMQTDLTTGEVSLELINDFRELQTNYSSLHYSSLHYSTTL